MSHIFISYSTRNSDYAARLAERLRASGFDVWIDNAKLRSSDNWWEAIVYALRQCGAFIIIMTPEARQSRWVQREVTLADNWQKRIFPLLLEGDNWEIFVLTQYSDVRSGELPPQAFFDKLAEVAPRQQGSGRIVTPTARPRGRRKPEPDDDAAVMDAIAESASARAARFGQLSGPPGPADRFCADRFCGPHGGDTCAHARYSWQRYAQPSAGSVRFGRAAQ